MNAHGVRASRRGLPPSLAGTLALQVLHLRILHFILSAARRIGHFRSMTALSRLLVVCAALACTGCSTFKQEWREAAVQPTPVGSPAGRWEGTWTSAANGHHGRLRCIVTPQPDGTHLFHFWARFGKIFHATYRLP